jgi:hypothetical protein
LREGERRKVSEEKILGMEMFGDWEVVCLWEVWKCHVLVTFVEEISVCQAGMKYPSTEISRRMITLAY